ncbi:uncharacterized protein [Drosophila suzukii]|uniref:Reverse transcriptase domain-containing protein n=1 Tax=Drosophila suzukii TaxID=28584 RepID=A0ABM4TYG1_DROSZ
MYDGLLRLPMPANVHVTGFADDVAITIVTKTTVEVEDMAKTAAVLQSAPGVRQQKGRSDRQIARADSPEHEEPKLIASVVTSQVLCAAPVWAKAATTPSYMSGVARTHRICATRISCAFRIISEEATLVIAGLVPVQELVREAVEVEVTVTTTETNLGETASEREIHLSVVDIYLTQILSGHGCFQSYLKKYGHDTSAGCPSCGSGIEEYARRGQETATGVSTILSTLVPAMLRGQMEWDATSKFAASVMRKLRIAKRERIGLDT